MNRVQLRFYTRELEEYHTVFLYEWLLVLGSRLGITAGTATRAIAGYGRFDGMNSRDVGELKANRPIVVEFNLDEEQADKLLGMLRAEQLRVPYTRQVVEYHDGPDE